MKLQLSKAAFWDVDLPALDEQVHRDFIIARVFQYGLLDDFKIVLKTYSKEQIVNALNIYRGLDKNSIALAKVLGYINE